MNIGTLLDLLGPPVIGPLLDLYGPPNIGPNYPLQIWTREPSLTFLDPQKDPKRDPVMLILGTLADKMPSRVPSWSKVTNFLDRVLDNGQT